jgi:hypothetical protein
MIYNLDIDEGNACRALLARFELAVSETTLGGLLIALEGIAGQTVTDENGAIGPSEQASNAKEALSEAKSLYPTSVHACISEHLSTLIPKFFYFDHYSELKGRTESGPLIEAVRTETVSTLEQDQRTALALLQLGYATDALVNDDYEKRSGEMEAVAADLT